ncbi:unnamed protein product [Rotaria socialis]|uniref:Kelch domain-containing protein 10 n=3 Tax=Rotaria socialis TaxID=392032 RepID=A0A817Z2D1_9BILA|nr:unnamed protein product [Rotaria socialis]CAF4629398.1 unnamed protein product [Rotaria socialis]
MTDDPTTNQKSSTESSEMNDSANTNRSKQPFRLSTKYISSINLMRFAEVSPLENNNKPLPRSGHRAVATESDFWIWGGYFPSFNHQQQPMFNELWRFNYARREWTLETVEGDGPNLTLASHSMCLYRNLAFVFGGTGFPFGETVSNRLYILDLKRLQWKHCPIANQEPEQVYGASMLVHNDHLYILCGTNRWSYNTNVYDIHLPTLTCTQIGHTFDEIDEFNENGRYRQEVYLYDQKIFVFGGGGGSGISYSLENLPVFDIDNRRWSFVHTNPDPIHNFPQGRKFHSIFPFGNNQVIMFGGAHFDTVTSAHHTVSEHLWTFDFEKLEWSMLQSLNMVQSTYFHAAAMNSRGEIWTHGGVIQDSAAIPHETRITNLYKMHTRVLHLSEIAWNYFLNCLADRKSLLQQPEVLSRLNIPKRFVGRIH